MTTISITKAISMSVEDFQKLTLEQLQELHKQLKDSKQKKALRKADLVSGVINSKKKARSEEMKQQQEQQQEQKEVVTVENSPKTIVKPKPQEQQQETPKKNVPKLVRPAKAKPQEQPKQQQEQSGGVTEATEQPKQEQQQPEEKPSFKRPQQEQPDFTKMSKEDLLLYVAQLEKKAEKFPSVIEGTKTKYTLTDFDSIEAIQATLLKNPMNLYLFADEKIDEKKTQFLVLFASHEVIVLLDRNRTKNSTITIETKNITGTHLKFPKDKQQFEYAFYIREKK